MCALPARLRSVCAVCRPKTHGLDSFPSANLVKRANFGHVMHGGALRSSDANRVRVVAQATLDAIARW